MKLRLIFPTASLVVGWGFVCLTTTAAPLPGAALNSAPVDRSHWPAALQRVRLERLSSGAIALLDRGGDLVRPALSSENLPAAAEVAVTLDLRVAPDLRLGNDPPALPPNMRAQAEPHIARSPVDPNFLTAVFQEGRFTDGGAVDCGFSVTHDGGLTWTRALIPKLTTASGGSYLRATDPVAGIDLSGRLFLNTEAATTADFSDGTILISRSTDGGSTFDPPVVVYHPPNDTIFPDKPWFAINTFSGTATEGRIVATWTQFGTTDASPIFRAYSDDHGLTWSAAAAIHAATTSAQGSQPVFLRDGRLAIIYWNFAGGFDGGDAPLSGPEEIEMVLSNDGGVTFGPPTLVTTVARYDQPSIRNGVFLPSATTDRSNGHLSLVYQALETTGAPRIFFTKTSNAGMSWTTPVAITDNPGTGVFNAALAASPDGQRLIASFYDQRDNAPGDTLHCNLYLAQSFDGGATWQPNIRLTSKTTNAALAPLTDQGYMLGDYLGIAESTNPDVPAVPVWVDTRTGNPDPFITRVGLSPEVDFTSFQASRLSLGQINDPQLGGPAGDADGDGESNLSEFLSGTEPNDSTSVLHPARQLNISTRETVGTGEDVLIGGFIITGATPKQVLLRALGPSLANQGLDGLLQNPTLELHDESGAIIAENDNWKATQEAAIEATGLAPNDFREAAILITLAPGKYTAIVQGQAGGSGTALVEAYDLDAAPASRFGNISTRGFVGTGTDVLIGGVIVAAEEAGQANLILRALGPSLGEAGVSDPLADPTLELHNADGALLAANDNWQDTQGGIIASAGLAPNDAREAAIFATVPAGNYTAVVRGANATTGVGLVEVFNIP